MLGRTPWPRGVGSGSAAAHLLGLQVRIHLGHGCLHLVCVWCLVNRGLSDWPIPRPEEFYRVCVCH
jgi:hypothetical protein